jgi:Domain of unknown function (DUF4398)
LIPPRVGRARVGIGGAVGTLHAQSTSAMTRTNFTIYAALAFALGCAGSYPPPTSQMADVQAANRAATELGAQKNPKAQLHLKLAEEQHKQAEAAMEDDDNRSAERLLMRAKADAELALALTHEESAKMQETKAIEQANSQQGAKP